MSCDRTSRSAFTLAEVVFALVLTGIAILVLASFLPTALRMQQQVRFRMYAGTKALEMVEIMLNKPSETGADSVHLESDRPWDTTVGYKAWMPDLEAKVNTPYHGFYTVPRQLAYRIDSQNDTIKRHLDAGGELYYAQPVVTNMLKPYAGLEVRPPHEAGKMVFAIVGAPQLNALPVVPWKAWPYRVNYPWQPLTSWEAVDDPDLAFVDSCDLHGNPSLVGRSDSRSPDWVDYDCDGDPTNPKKNLTSGASELNVNNDRYGSSDFRQQLAVWGKPGWLAGKSYLGLALWYVHRKALEEPNTTVRSAILAALVPFLEGRAGAAERAALVEACDRSADPMRLPRLLTALRVLAHAGLHLTKWYPLEAWPEDRPKQSVINIPNPKDPTDIETHTYYRIRALGYGLRLGIPIPGDDPLDGDLYPPPSDSATSSRRIPDRPAYNPDGRGSRLTLAQFFRLVGPSAWVRSGTDRWEKTPLWEPSHDPAIILPPVRSGHPLDPTAPADPADRGKLAGHFFVTHDMIVNWHESILALGTSLAAERPYDWGWLRPANRQIMSDHPLVQYDLFAPRLAGAIWGTPNDPNLDWTRIPAAVGSQATGIAAEQWRVVVPRHLARRPGGLPVYSREVENLSRNSYGPCPDWSAIAGSASACSLTAPFAPAERCRQLVAYMVEWQSWRDAETAPSAPVDASRYPLASAGLISTFPNPSRDEQTKLAYESFFTRGVMGNSTQSSNTLVRLRWFDQGQPWSRNPEKCLAFVRPVDGQPILLQGVERQFPFIATGINVRPLTMGPDTPSSANNAYVENEPYLFVNDQADYLSDQGYGWDPDDVPDDARAQAKRAACGWPDRYWRCDPKALFLGVYGADRNANQLLDRGPLPPSTRLRAVEVARFNVYDPRLTMSLR